MNQFFVEPSAIFDGYITITGGDVNHIQNVLRLRPGDNIQIVGLQNQLTYFCTIDSFCKESVKCLILDVQSESAELPVNITLYQGLPKSDKLEFVIQKAVEMGASRIVPVAMKRSVVKLDPKKVISKQKRFQAIAASAAAQSKRSVIPQVDMTVSYKEAIEELGKADFILLPYELAAGMDETRSIMQQLKALADEKNAQNIKPEIAIIIGPEGGFEDSEVKMAEEAGAHIITLGRRILRTETAPLAILAWLTYILEK